MAENNDIEPKDEEKFPIQRLLTKDAVLIFLISGIGYLGAYVYKMGQFFSLRIPSGFYALDLKEIIAFSITFYFILYFASQAYLTYRVAKMLDVIVDKRLIPKIIYKIPAEIMIVSLFAFVWLFIYLGQWVRFLLVLCSLILYIVFCVVWYFGSKKIVYTLTKDPVFDRRVPKKVDNKIKRYATFLDYGLIVILSLATLFHYVCTLRIE